jgi:tRNA(Ile)-lysidine synthase
VALDPAVAAVRLAVRRGLADLPGRGTDGPTAPAAVLVACSGGADSLALLAATVFEARAVGVRVLGVTVDHDLQEGSGEHADRVVAQMATLGADETIGVRVRVEAGGRGVEAAAREARYAVLEEVAARTGAAVVLLGHTLDDQAETVLLGLTRGSGGRSIAGMRHAFDVFRRPLLGVTREQTEAACRAERVDFWEDPHNTDPRFTRSRIRHRVLPVLEEELGPGVAAALARTADGLRADLEALDLEADRCLAEVAGPEGLDVVALREHPAAIRTRVLRLAALAAGAVASELFRVHLLALDDLVAGGAGRAVDLPGHLRGVRRGGALAFEATGRGDGTGRA